MTAPASRPNVLFLFPDQWRGDWLSTHPDLPLRTPTLDRLAARGVRVTNCLTPSPLCAPARAALASGKCYERCGVVDNGQDYPLEQPTFYQMLRDAGYSVGGVGKFDLHKATLDWGTDGKRLLPEWGYTHGIDNEGKFDAIISHERNDRPMGPYMQMLQDRDLLDVHKRMYEEGKKQGGLMDAVTDLPDEAYCDNWVGRNGLDVLEAFPADQPWFLQVNFTGPHNPFDVTRDMRDRWADVAVPPAVHGDKHDPAVVLACRQNYAAMIENIDRNIGLLLDAVEARGEGDNTLVVFSSDHGEMLGDHNRFGKTSWYHPSVHVPLIVAGPGVKAQPDSDALVSLHDLAATFLDAASLSVPAAMDSRSLWPLLRRETDAHRCCVTSGLKAWSCVYDGRYKLVRQGDSSPLLFDREADPWETTDIAATRPAERDRLLAQAPAPISA